MVWLFFVMSAVMAVGIVSFLRIQGEINVHLRGEETRTSFGVYAIAVLVTVAVLALLWFVISNINWLSAIFYVIVRFLTTFGIPTVIFLEIRRVSRNPANNPDPTQLYHKWMWLVWLDILPILLLLWWSSSWCTWQGNVGFFFRLLLWFCTSLTIAMMIESRFRYLSWIRLAVIIAVLLIILGFVFFTIRGGWVTQLIFFGVGPVMVPITFGYGWSHLVDMYLVDESVYSDDENSPAAPATGQYSTARRPRHAAATSENRENGTTRTAVRVPID